MDEISAGIWHWQAPHPEWTPAEWWPEVVSSYAIDDGVQLVLVDPLAVPGDILRLAGDRDSVVVLTAPWHERDTRALVEHLGLPVFVPTPDTAADLVRKYGITMERAAGGSPDVAWLLGEHRDQAHLYAAGSLLPMGIEAFRGWEHNDLVLWVEHCGAVILGDTLVDYGQGFEVNRRLPGSVTRAEIIERLRPLLALPIRLVLPAHGTPTDRTALERALS